MPRIFAENRNANDSGMLQSHSHRIGCRMNRMTAGPVHIVYSVMVMKLPSCCTVTV